MSSQGHILLIDDDPDFVAIYREMLQREGLVVTVAHTPDEATRILEAGNGELDVILLDQKLQGRGGPDSGFELLGRIEGLAPLAKTILVTGYASPEAIERAFQLGVYDYLVKNGAFEALLRAKVRNAIEVTTERRLAALTVVEVVRDLRATWQLVRSESDRNRKGKLLEELAKLLFRATPGFEQVVTRLDNSVEEIDVMIENRSEDPLWRNDGSAYLIAECKNWSSKCGSGEFRNFHAKLTNKYRRVRTGFLVAPGGFTDEFHRARAEHKVAEVLVIPVDDADLARWIEATDRVELLRELHRKAVFELG
jgi:CheY-like chemotaxis protein